MYTFAYCCVLCIFSLIRGFATCSSPGHETEHSFCPYIVVTGKILQYTSSDSENDPEPCWILEISDDEMKRLIKRGRFGQEDSLVTAATNCVQLVSPNAEIISTECIGQEVLAHGYLRLVPTNILTPITIELLGVYLELNDEAIDSLEEHIPELALIACREAYVNALASGFSVVISENNALIELFPDGTKKFIKDLPPRIPVVCGQTLTLP